MKKIKHKIRQIYYVYKHRWDRKWGSAKMQWKGGFYNGSKIVKYLPPEEGNTYLKSALSENKPFMAARYGTYELMGVAEAKYGFEGTNVLYRLCNNAGFFPHDRALLDRFARVYTEATQQVDCFAAWNFRLGFWKYEEGVFRDFCPEAALTDIRAIKFLKHERPWTSALRGKKVLVIHPFVDTIRKQYAKREHLFPGRDVLPEFACLETIRAVQSAAGAEVPFATWFEALDSMRAKMEAVDFDVALIGAGAYGLPLAAHARQLGRQAVHMGGATQMLFGIMGHRWKKKGRYGHLENEYWTRPSEHEIPPKAQSIEGGAYW